MSYRASLVAVVLIAGVLGGCSLPQTKQAAEKKAAELYDKLAAGNIDDALNLYSPLFYTKIKRDQWRNVLLNVRERLGTYRSRRLVKWNVRSHWGAGGSRTVTTLVYQVKYSKAEATEVLVFTGGGGSKPAKLVGHNINSLALLPAGPPKKPAVKS